MVSICTTKLNLGYFNCNIIVLCDLVSAVSTCSHEVTGYVTLVRVSETMPNISLLSEVQ